jgi:PIN domain nuclease of toxin-antitoxin system
MPRLLLDTHSFLWFVTADPKLSAPAQRLIATGANEPLLSVACVWEIAIKVSIGRLPLPEPLHTFIPEQLRVNRIEVLPIELRHTFEVARLPLHHRDPLDRLLIAQVLVEGLPIVSADTVFDHYPIQRLW